jgi:hypothetical protein
MKVVCIDDHTLSSGRKIKGLTTGKIYDAEDKNLEFTYRIVDDNGEKHWYMTRC